MKSIRTSCLVLALAAGTASAQWSDDFNRPNGPIGGDWTPVTGNWVIDNNMGGMSATTSSHVLRHNSASAPYTDVVVYLDAINDPLEALNYQGPVIGLGGNDSILVKIQDQVAGTNGFSHIGIYNQTAPGASTYTSGSWGNMTLPGGAVQASGFAALPAGAADNIRIKVSFPDPNTIQVDLDNNIDGTYDWTYTRTGVSNIAGNFGMNYGINSFNSGGRFDNWEVSGGQTCYPDCDQSGTLDLFDFLCFVNEFNSGNPYADCDGSGGLDLFDFLCFVNEFNNGCP